MLASKKNETHIYDGDEDDDNGYVKNSPRSLLVDDGKALPTSGNSRGLDNCHDDEWFANSGNARK